MLDPIHGRYRWEEETFLAATRVVVRSNRRFEATRRDGLSSRQRRRQTIIMLLLFGLVGTLWLIGLVRYTIQELQAGHLPEGLVFWGIVATILVVLIALIIKKNRNAPRAAYTRIPEGLKEVEWFVDDAGIRMTTEMSDTRCSWDLIERAEETDRFFVLFEPGNQGRVFPKVSFDDPADVDRFRALCKSKGKLMGELLPAPKLQEL